MTDHVSDTADDWSVTGGGGFLSLSSIACTPSLTFSQQPDIHKRQAVAM